MRTKVLIIGLDGASFNLIKPWAESGKILTLRKVMKSGTCATLKSTMPPDTPPAWTSIVTGKNPGKHGVFGFLDTTIHFGKKSKNYDFNTINSTHRKSEAIWNILSVKGRKVVVVNVPLTYPPEKVNGVMISGFLTPSTSNNFTYPQNLREKILEKGYEIGTGGKGKFREEFLKNSIRKKCDISIWLMRNFDWDFFMIVFMETDRVLHYFGGDEKIVLKIYQEVDLAIERILKNASKNTTIFIISDHGFKRFNKVFFINTWLSQKGLLHIRNKAYVPIKVRQLVGSMHIPLIGRFMDYTMHFFGFDVNEVIDYPKGKCFCISHGTSYSGIKLNVKGREPKGVVESGSNYESLRNFMMTELKKLKDPVRKQPVIKRIYKTENLYWGPYTDQLPDIIVEAEREYVISPDFENYTHVMNSTTYTHDIHGILMATGPYIKRDAWLKSQVNVWDVAPTVLHILGVPIPCDMDGRVLKEIFEPEYNLEKRAIMYEKVEGMGKKAYRWKEEEEKEIRGRLRRLGYI